MGTVKSWEHNGRTYRIVGQRRLVREYGYADRSDERYNVLQIRLRNPLAILFNLSLWSDVEEERIPSFAWISEATLGSTSWVSSLHQKCRSQMGML